MKKVMINKRGQITIPIEIRQRLGLKAGEQIVLILSGDQIILRPVNRTLLDLRGCVPVSGEQDFAAVRVHTAENRTAQRQEQRRI